VSYNCVGRWSELWGVSSVLGKTPLKKDGNLHVKLRWEKKNNAGEMRSEVRSVPARNSKEKRKKEGSFFVGEPPWKKKGYVRWGTIIAPKCAHTDKIEIRLNLK